MLCKALISDRKNLLTLFIFFRNILAILGPLLFPIHFRISLLSSVTNPVVILTWISKSVGEKRYATEFLLSLIYSFLSLYIGILWYLLIKFPNFHHYGPIYLLLDFLLATLFFIAIANSIFQEICFLFISGTWKYSWLSDINFIFYHFVNFLINFNFSYKSLEFSMQICMLTADNDTFISCFSILIPFISFACLNALTRTSSTMIEVLREDILACSCTLMMFNAENDV